MSLHLRNVQASDLDTILAINNNAGDSIIPIDGTRMARFLDIARYFRVAEIEGQVAGFLIALTPEADYDSPNFRWFQSQFDEFVYIDRVVLTPNVRRSGVGRLFYADVLNFAEIRSSRLTCEVFIEPRDHVSMIFFTTQGFKEVGQQELPNARKVSLMSKTLDDYSFVRETYLQANVALPEWAWKDRLSGNGAQLKLSA